MNFRFRLAKVLRVAELREEAVSRRVAEAQAATEAAAQSLEGTRQEYHLILRAQARRLIGALDLGAILAGNGQLDHLEHRAGEEEISLADRQAEEAVRRGELTQALQRRRVLEKLEAKRRSQHARDEERREAILLTEIPRSLKGGEA